MRGLWALFAAVMVAGGQPVVREEQKVRVNGVEEVWRLVWRSAPKPACEASGAWLNCPCSGFAFGESGDLDLVRTRSGNEIERLSLTALFGETPVEEGRAVLQRWERTEKDLEAGEFSLELERALPGRPPVHIMALGDYNHDGQATEFFLQTETQPCGKQYGVVIGVSARNPRLHVFGSVRKPEQPLELQRHQWSELRDSSKAVTVVDWACGDHGSDEQTELYLQATPRGIEGVRRRYACTDNSKRGHLLSEDPL